MRNLLELEPRELRVLGALMEKQQTTPEYYPMTLKGLVAACNQKTNRDPVMALGELEVLNVLRVLLQEELVERTSGARADRWGHRVDPVVRHKPDRKAVLTLLLLRGAQTPGELRARSERMHPFESLEEVDRALRELGAETPPLAAELPRRPGQKETRWALSGEGFEDESEETEPAAATARGESFSSRLSRLEEAVQRLEAEVAELRGSLDPSEGDRPTSEEFR